MEKMNGMWLHGFRSDLQRLGCPGSSEISPNIEEFEKLADLFDLVEALTDLSLLCLYFKFNFPCAKVARMYLVAGLMRCFWRDAGYSLR